MDWEVTSENVSLWVQQRAHLEVADPLNYRISTKVSCQSSVIVQRPRWSILRQTIGTLQIIEYNTSDDPTYYNKMGSVLWLDEKRSSILR